MVGDVPLGGLREIVVANFREVALLPKAAIDERDVVFCEFGELVGGEVGDDRVGMFARVADYVGHGSFFPVGVDFGVALFAFLRADVVGGDCGLLLLGNFGRSWVTKVANYED